MQSSAFHNETNTIKSSVRQKDKTNSEHPFKQMIDGIESEKNYSSSFRERDPIDEGRLRNREDTLQEIELEGKGQEIAAEDESSQIVADPVISLEEDVNVEPITDPLAYLFNQVLADKTLTEKSLSDLQIKDLSQIDMEINDELSDELVMQITMLLNELKQLIANGTPEQGLEQVARDLHKMFQLWSQLEQEQKQQIISKLEVDSEDEQGLLRHLISLFDKRNSFAKQQVYQMNASITQEDVEKWLQQSLNKYTLLNHESFSANLSQAQPMQMNQIQQYTLHVTEGHRIDAISRNLASDLSNIINRSSFLKQAGLEELTLTLRPHSLGDVTIRLAQINGEITVRFLVTTEAAKKLFEANLHQLKPMFAPNQVVVERDLTIADDDFFQEEQEQLEEEHKEENEEQDMPDDTNEYDLSFEDLLQFLSEEANE